MAVLGWILTALMGLTALLWVLLVVGVVVASRDRRFVLDASPGGQGDGDDGAPPQPLVSIVIPARNEEGSIGHAVRTALGQTWRSLEVIVVDDASEDRTADEAREAGGGDERLRVVPGRPLPSGWLGKPSAVWHGQTLARGDVLLFIDADVKLAPTAVSQCVSAMESRGLDMLSLWGTWLMESFWERVVQPVVGGFVRGAHPLDKINDPDSPEAFANGQYIMIRRAAYDGFGGHEVVKDEVLEDVRFAQRAKEAGLRVGMYLAPELFSVRLYTSLSEIWHGMLKNFYHGMNRSAGLALLAAAFVTTTTLLPFVVAVLGGVAGHGALVALACVNIALMFCFRFIQDGLMGMSRVYGLTHPLGTAVLVGIILVSMWRGLRKTPTSWKGRAVQG